MVKKTLSPEKRIYSGKRKTAIAKLRVKSGKGIVTFNYLPITELSIFHKLALLEPLRIFKSELGDDLKYDLHVKTHGGGKESQIQAARLVIAKALVALTESATLKKAFIKYDRNLMVADNRRKETRKPGDSKARAKRQKSFR